MAKRIDFVTALVALLLIGVIDPVRAEDEGPVDQSQFLDKSAAAPAAPAAPAATAPNAAAGQPSASRTTEVQVPSAPKQLFSTPTPTAAPSGDASLEELLTLRDPFRRMINVESDVNVKLLSELEQYPVEEFKLVGVMTGPRKTRAMLRAPSGSTHFVSLNQKIGTRKGRVKRITPDYIEVTERSVNILGREELSTAKIELAPEFQQ